MSLTAELVKRGDLIQCTLPVHDGPSIRNGASAMGEVVVRVQLTNFADEIPARSGHIAAEKIRQLDVDAVVDTGAVGCVLPRSIADQLGVATAFEKPVRLADGRTQVVEVCEPVLFEILGRKVHEECLVMGEEVLIGQTALELTDLFVDCRSRKLVPNPENPDYPVIRIR